MDKNMDYNNFYGFGGYPPYDNIDPTSPEASIYNPILQYEQGYMYYRYLSQQLDYKIKCREYEKIVGKDNRSDRRVE